MDIMEDFTDVLINRNSMYNFLVKNEKFIDKNTDDCCDFEKILYGLIYFLGCKTIKKDNEKSIIYLFPLYKSDPDKYRTLSIILAKLYSDINIIEADKFYKIAITVKNDFKIDYANFLEHNNRENEAINFFLEYKNKITILKKLIKYVKAKKLDYIKIKDEFKKYDDAEIIYEHSTICDSKDERIELLKKCIEKNYILAIKDLCKIYYEDGEDIELIEDYYNKAINSNDFMSYYELGNIYLDEKYYDKDKAIECFKKAKENGILIADMKLIELGVIL